MRRLLKLLLLLVALVGLFAYLGSGWLLRRATDAALPRLQRLASARGIELSEVGYGSVGLGSLKGAVWKDVELLVALPRNVSGYSNERFRVRIEAASAELVGWSLGRFRLSARKLEAAVDDRLSSDFDWASERFREAAVHGRLEASRVSFELAVDRSDPEADLRRIYNELARLAREGRTALPAEISAVVRTVLDGEAVVVRLETVAEGGETVLEVDREDLVKRVRNFSRELTEAEIDVVAAYPLRAPRLLFLKKYAESTAAAARKADSTVPEDAYRHVLWSYLLTRTYGAEFAERVTDAHEIGATDNTEADHRMDYNNNAVGRRYAARGVPESAILQRVRRDPEVVRKPV